MSTTNGHPPPPRLRRDRRIDTNLMGQTADDTDLGSAPVPGAGEGVPPSRTSLNQSTSSRGRSIKCGSGLSAAMVGTLRSLPHSWLDHKKESPGRIYLPGAVFSWRRIVSGATSYRANSMYLLPFATTGCHLNVRCGDAIGRTTSHPMSRCSHGSVGRLAGVKKEL